MPNTAPRTNMPRALKALLDWLDNAPWHINNSVETINGTVAVQAASLTRYKTIVNLAHVGDNVTIGNGSGVVEGFRKLIKAGTRAGSSTCILDHANIKSGGSPATAAVLDAANEFVLLEWRGDAWHVIAASSGVVTT